jgi:hypothetical protein
MHQIDGVGPAVYFYIFLFCHVLTSHLLVFSGTNDTILPLSVISATAHIDKVTSPSIETFLGGGGRLFSFSPPFWCCAWLYIELGQVSARGSCDPAFRSPLNK